MKIYLDATVYNRPFEDQTNPKILLETLAFGVVLQLEEKGLIKLVSSAILEYENSINPFALRKKWVENLMQRVHYCQELNDEIIERAQKLKKQGLQVVDALHLASAEMAGSDYFLTCDRHLFQGYQGSVNVTNPIYFVLAITEG